MTATKQRRPLPAAYPLPEPTPPTDALAPGRSAEAMLESLGTAEGTLAVLDELVSGARHQARRSRKPTATRRVDDTPLTKEDELRVARAAELDLRSLTDAELDLAELQRVLEGTARQSRDQLWKRAAFSSSEASARRMLREVRRLRSARAAQDAEMDAYLEAHAAGPDAPSPEEHAADLAAEPPAEISARVAAAAAAADAELVAKPRRSRKPAAPASTKPVAARKPTKPAATRSAATKAEPAAPRRRNKLWRCPVCKTRTRAESCPRDATPAPAGKRLAAE